MPKVKNGIVKRAKRRVGYVLFGGRPRANLHWFYHPQVQAGVAEAEADLLNGRSYRTSSAAETQALFDSWK
jgi:hypothetical protein